MILPLGLWAAVLPLIFCLPCRLVADERETPSATATSFRSADVQISASDHQLAGTLYLPNSNNPVPAVVLVHGAGPATRSDRYKELAKHFAEQGVAALIYDKQGCGASTGDWTRASKHDLADDALAWVALLRKRPDVSPNQVGLWGLSQGGSVVPIAASQAPEVAFVIVVGACLDFEQQMRYFRANVFQGLGHPPAALDVANKAFQAQVDLGNRVRSGSVPAPQWLRDASRFAFDLDHQAVWRQVRQPILAIYGEQDKQVPVAENVRALSAALELSGHREFTLIVYPNASHSVGMTRTGQLGEAWQGYVPEYLTDMTDWVLERAGATKKKSDWSRQGQLLESDHLRNDERNQLLWYGTAPMQAIQFLGFCVVFLVTTVVGSWRLLRGARSGHPTSSRLLQGIATALSILNLALLAGLIVVVLGLSNQWKPHYPQLLNWLPVLGLLSVGLTVTLLLLLFARRKEVSRRWRAILGWFLFVICTMAFLPFLGYWNLVGLPWH